MEKTVNQLSEETHGRFENNHSTINPQDPMKFFQRRSRKVQMMKNIEQDQVGNGCIGKIKGVGILLPIQPWIGENISCDAGRDKFFDRSNSGTELDNRSRKGT